MSLTRDQLQGLRVKSVEPYINTILANVHRTALDGGTQYYHSLPGFDKSDAENFVGHLANRFPGCMVKFVYCDYSHGVLIDWS